MRLENAIAHGYDARMPDPIGLLGSVDDRIHAWTASVLGPADPDPWVTKGGRLVFIRVVAALMISLVLFAIVSGLVALAMFGVRLLVN